jgi:hypothetical protein
MPLFPLASRQRRANFLRPHILILEPIVSEILLPILVFTVPILAIVFLALSGRKLSGSCGGVGPDGRCARCGKAADAMPGAHDRQSCP